MFISIFVLNVICHYFEFHHYFGPYFHLFRASSRLFPIMKTSKNGSIELFQAIDIPFVNFRTSWTQLSYSKWKTSSMIRGWMDIEKVINRATTSYTIVGNELACHVQITQINRSHAFTLSAPQGLVKFNRCRKMIIASACWNRTRSKPKRRNGHGLQTSLWTWLLRRPSERLGRHRRWKVPTDLEVKAPAELEALAAGLPTLDPDSLNAAESLSIDRRIKAKQSLRALIRGSSLLHTEPLRSGYWAFLAKVDVRPARYQRRLGLRAHWSLDDDAGTGRAVIGDDRWTTILLPEVVDAAEADEDCFTLERVIDLDAPVVGTVIPLEISSL